MTDQPTGSIQHLGVTLRVSVPGVPVSYNHAHRRSGSRTYLNREARAWKACVSEYVEAAVLQNGLSHARGRILHARIGYIFLGVGGDASNYVKLTEDAIASALWTNDKQFEVAHVRVEPTDPKHSPTTALCPTGANLTLELTYAPA